MKVHMMSSTAIALKESPEQKAPEYEIIKFISQFVRLSETEAEALLDTLDIRVFKKGDFLLKEGQVKDLCCFVLKGCVRQYYLVDGEEKTTNFYTEGQPVIPHEGVANRLPAKFFLSCIEECILIVGSKIDDATFSEKFPKVDSASRIALESLWSNQQEQFAHFMINSPEERYLHLLDTRPDLLDRVPHYQLASYLGIKPESLSRIRKRIMLK
jgi:CRP-like cAMP-binding protein